MRISGEVRASYSRLARGYLETDRRRVIAIVLGGYVLAALACLASAYVGVGLASLWTLAVVFTLGMRVGEHLAIIEPNERQLLAWRAARFGDRRKTGGVGLLLTRE